MKDSIVGADYREREREREHMHALTAVRNVNMRQVYSPNSSIAG